MKATRLYTRAYLTRIKYRGEEHRLYDLSKIEVTEFSSPTKIHAK